MIISIFIKFHTRNTFFRENNLQCNNLLKSCQKRGKINVSVNSSAWPLNKHLSHKSSKFFLFCFLFCFVFFTVFNVELQELLRIVIIGSRITNFCHCSPEYCFLSAQSLISAQILVNPASPFVLKTRIPLTFPESLGKSQVPGTPYRHCYCSF